MITTTLRRRIRVAVATGALAALIAACGAAPSAPPPTPSTDPTGTSAPSATESSQSTTEPTPQPSTSTPAPETTQPAVPVISDAQLRNAIGTVFMVGVPATGAPAADLKVLTDYSVSNVFLKGRSTQGVAGTKQVTDRIRAALKKPLDGRRMVISTDQEGGLVQVLQGAGFSTIPKALEQGKLNDSDLKAAATTWGKQLAQAGVDLNLAPIGDTVKDAASAANNKPIGYFARQFAYDPDTIAHKTSAFSRGMRAAGVGVTIKHFPGLGYVTGNTDVTADVQDSVTTTSSPSLIPFKDAIARGEHWVMVSSAIYTQIDPENIAAFSPTIITDLLRKKLGFTGIIISDDLCRAKAAEAYGFAERAKRFFAAGGTMFLCVDADKGEKVMSGLYNDAKNDPILAQRIMDAAHVVSLNVGR